MRAAATPDLQVGAAMTLDAEFSRLVVREQLGVRGSMRVVAGTARQRVSRARIPCWSFVGMRVNLCSFVTLSTQLTLRVL